MDELLYHVSVAFSGSDLARALWIGLMGSLLCSARHPPAHVLVLAAAIDGTWPFVAMIFAGHDVSAVSAALGHGIMGVPENVMAIAMRLLGLYGLLVGGYWLRLMVHGRRPELRPSTLKSQRAGSYRRGPAPGR